MFKINSSVRQRKEGKKNAKTAKQQSRNQSKKTSNENSNTVYARKTATSGEKTQGKRQTPGKIFYERQANFGQTENTGKGTRTAKQQQRGQLCLSQTLANTASKSFRFQFKKKISQSIFFKTKIGKFLLVEKNSGIPLMPLHWTPH